MAPFIFLKVFGVCFDGRILTFSSSSSDGGGLGSGPCSASLTTFGLALGLCRRTEGRVDIGRKASMKAMFVVEALRCRVPTYSSQAKASHAVGTAKVFSEDQNKDAISSTS
jgi:hypothetical protein